MQTVLDSIVSVARKFMAMIAKGLNKLGGGHISPSMLTITSFIAHLPIAYLIGNGEFVWGAVLLFVFGLFDALDGELARLQNKASSRGMVLDAVTDRMKEVLIYASITYYFVQNNMGSYAVWATALCGGALLVSYVKAKGETAVKDKNLSPNQINKLFSDGLMRYEVRMFFVIVGLLSDKIQYVVVFLAICTWITAFSRLYKIINKLG